MKDTLGDLSSYRSAATVNRAIIIVRLDSILRHMHNDPATLTTRRPCLIFYLTYFYFYFSLRNLVTCFGAYWFSLRVSY